MMMFSKQVWNQSAHIYDKIIKHKFNQELMIGTLSQNKFAYYIEQDSLYLQDFARCHAIISSKISFKYMRSFLKYADDSFLVEHEVIHQFFNKIFNFKVTGLVSTATLGYTSYLLKICLNDPIEVAVAAILPCFWVYREVGSFIEKYSKKDNPYIRWIETYASKEFSNAVDEVIKIFDELANNTTEDIRIKMQEAFHKSIVWEWHFWNDSYELEVFDNIKNNSF